MQQRAIQEELKAMQGSNKNLSAVLDDGELLVHQVPDSSSKVAAGM